MTADFHDDDPRFERGFPRDDAAFDQGWTQAHVGFERDDFELQGLKVWFESWRRVESASLILWHPAYPQQRHAMEVYEIGDPASPVRFAAGELSNGVWGFFTPGA